MSQTSSPDKNFGSAPLVSCGRSKNIDPRLRTRRPIENSVAIHSPFYLTRGRHASRTVVNYEHAYLVWLQCYAVSSFQIYLRLFFSLCFPGYVFRIVVGSTFFTLLYPRHRLRKHSLMT